MADKFVATFTLAAQVTEDSYKVFQHHLECSPDTKLETIIRWRDSFGKGAAGISLTISKLDQP